MVAPTLSRRAAALVLALALASMVTAPPGNAEPPRIPVPQTALIRLDGTWGPPSGGHVAAADLELDRGDSVERFQVERVEVLRGDRSGPDVPEELRPYKPSLFLRGPEALLHRLDGARPGDHVVMTGYHRSGSRDLLVSDIVVQPAGPADAPR